MQIKKDFSLKNFNTFGIDVKARFFVAVTNVQELKNALELKEYPEKFILGGGSNMLLVNDINALVIHVNNKGKTIISENDKHVKIKVMAGENWHQFVLWTIEQGFGGLENMSLIPGNTGTAPVQNIGAYGVELKDSFVCCEAINRENLEVREFSKKDCKFGYRESFFKSEGKDAFVITNVTFALTKRDHKLHTGYGAIEEELQMQHIVDPSIKDISNAVISIRNNKLPDPKEIGNSGSFFKNPIITKSEFENFTKKHPTAPFYKVSESAYKIPAGWLIEQCGFKGKRFGDAGVHTKQALVLVNYDKATGEEILGLAHTIIKAVYAKFGISIQPEVNVIK